MSDKDDAELALDSRVLESRCDEILHTLAHLSPGGEAEALKDMDRIRKAFESSEAEFRSAQRAAVPRVEAEPCFPGYTPLGKLGSGGFASVHRARDEKLGRDIALKVLHPTAGREREASLRFLEEARALARVRHPNVVAIHAVLEKEDGIALAMELIEGRTLDRIVGDGGPLSAGEAAQVGAEVCRALAAVHAQGIVHRDVKPSNVLREKGGRIVLADFGLGVFMARRDGSASAEIAGSPLFMAPEQAAGDPVDARTDIYAAGVLLYFLSTGLYPVPLGKVGEVLERVRAGDLIPLRDARADIPEAFARVVGKALSRDPESRFRSAGEMERALLECSGRGGGGEAAGPARLDPSPRPAAAADGRRPGWKAFLALGAIIIAAAAAIAMLSGVLGGSGDFRVERAALWSAGRRLADGDAIGIDAPLHLELQADRAVHVYVLNEDEKNGERHLLFPLPGGDLKNPLPPGRIHTLPGPTGGVNQEWIVSSAGGLESIFIVASVEPLHRLEGLASSTPAGGSHPEVQGEALAEVHRGIGKVAASKGPGGGASSSTLRAQIEEIRNIQETGGSTRGFWIRKVTLRNP